ncbi:MAG: hypothetical protein JWM11_4581 [Planctomycetaceae bacterium]|nr:hypothetical protein [Planctomycetaceae bacterium]
MIQSGVQKTGGINAMLNVATGKPSLVNRQQQKTQFRQWDVERLLNEFAG